jgi:hypothetical protein
MKKGDCSQPQLATHSWPPQGRATFYWLYFLKQNEVPNMPTLSQTLKGHNSETVCPFALKFFVEMYFDQLYPKSTKEVLGISPSIAIDGLSMPALGSP